MGNKNRNRNSQTTTNGQTDMTNETNVNAENQETIEQPEGGGGSADQQEESAATGDVETASDKPADTVTSEEPAIDAAEKPPVNVSEENTSATDKQAPAKTEGGDGPATETVIEQKSPDVVLDTAKETGVADPTPEVVEKKAEEQPTPKSTPKEEVIELPIAKSKAKTNTTITKNTEVPKPSVSLDKITVDELVKRKHGFNLSEAAGPLIDVLDFFDRYEESMKTSLEVGQTVGESLQKQMYKNYLSALSLESSKERDVALEVLLWKFYKDEKGAYGVTQLSRFTRTGRWHTEELNMYLQLNHIFYSVKNPLDRIQRLANFKLAAIIGAFPADKIRYTENFLNWAKALR